MNTTKSDLVFKQKIYRWDVYWCSLDQDIKTSASVLIGKPNRPCIVMSNDDYNNISSKVLVLPFCSNNSGIPDDEYIKKREKEGDVLIPMVLNRDETSFLIIEQPRLISKKMLQGYIGTLDIELNRELAIRITEEMFKYLIDQDVFKDTKFCNTSNKSTDSEENEQTIEEPKDDIQLELADYYAKYTSGEIDLPLLAMYTNKGYKELIDDISKLEKEKVSSSEGVIF